jgi:hypothetical protein
LFPDVALVGVGGGFLELGEIGKLLGVGEASWSWRSFLELGELGKLLGAGVLRRLLEVGQLFGNS